jgi:Tol biopolymer transport system component
VFHGGDDPDLAAVSADTGVVRILTRSVDRGSYVNVAPDGESVAYVSRATGNDEIVLLPWADGPERNLTNDPSSDINPVWSRDGRYLAFLSDRAVPSLAPGYQLYSLDLVTGEVQRVGQQFVLTRPVWVPASVP